MQKFRKSTRSSYTIFQKAKKKKETLGWNYYKVFNCYLSNHPYPESPFDIAQPEIDACELMSQGLIFEIGEKGITISLARAKRLATYVHEQLMYLLISLYLSLSLSLSLFLFSIDKINDTASIHGTWEILWL